MLKTNKNIETVVIGHGNSGRYEYQDTSGTVELGDEAFRVITETSGESVELYFKHKENAEKFLKS